METFPLYHGGCRWIGRPEVRAPKEGAYEGGVGLYFTTSWLRAKDYAKGNKVITIAEIRSDFTPIESVRIPRRDIADFLTITRMRAKKEILSDIDSNIARVGNGDFVNANVFNNLVVNHRAGTGIAGLAVSKFLSSHGVDAEIQRKGHEDWLLVLNPDIIKSHRVLSPKESPVWDFPTIVHPGKRDNPLPNPCANLTEVPDVGRCPTHRV